MNKRAWSILVFLLLAGLLLYSVIPDGTEWNANFNLNGNEYDFDSWHDLSWGGIFIGLIVTCVLAFVLVPIMLGLSLLMVGVFGLVLGLVFLAFAPLLLPGVVLILLIYLIARKSR